MRLRFSSGLDTISYTPDVATQPIRLSPPRLCIFRFLLSTLHCLLVRIRNGTMEHDAQTADERSILNFVEPVAWEETDGPFKLVVEKLKAAVAQEVNPANVFRTSPQRAERKMPDEVLDRNDELLRRFAPSLKKHIEDALDPILGPVVSVLQSHGEVERKQRQTFFALEEKKLALRSEKIQLQRRRRGRICQHRRRAFSENSSRRRIRQGLRLLSLLE